MESIRSAVINAFRLLDARMRKQLELPAPSRQPLLDPDAALQPGDLGVIGARLLDDAERLLALVALDAGPDRPVLLVVPDKHWMATLLLSIMAGIPASSISRPDLLLRDEIVRLVEARKAIEELPIEISDARVHAGNVVAVQTWLEEHPGGLALLSAAWPTSLGNDEQGAAEFVRLMKELARSTDGTIVIPWKLNASRRNDPRPMLRDLAVSGAAEDDADLVVLFYESEYGVEINLAKNRHGRTGHLYDSRDLGSSH